MPYLIEPAPRTAHSDTLSVNWASPLTRGLVAAFPNYQPGPARNVVRPRTSLPLVNGGRRTASAFGAALDCTTTDRGAIAICPDDLKVQPPFTIGVRFRQVVAPTANGQYFGISYDNADSSPFLAYCFGVDGIGTSHVINYNTSGGFQQIIYPVAYPVVVGQLVTLVASFSGDVSLIGMYFFNGVFVNLTPIVASVSFSATSLLGIGVYRNGIGRSCGADVIDAWIWKRVLSPAEIRSLSRHDYRQQLYRTPNTRVYFDIGAGPTPRRFFLV